MTTPSLRRAALRLLLALLPLGAGADDVSRLLLLDGIAVADTIFAVGENGAIVSSPDSGRTWSRLEPVTGATLTGISFDPDRSEGWAVGHDAAILHTGNGGKTWAPQGRGANPEDSFLDVCALGQGRAIAVGAYGLYQETEDSGATWSRRKVIDEDMHLNRITRGPSGTLYLAGESGTLLRSRDAGVSWQRLASPYEGSLYGVLPLSEETLLLHGLRGHVFLSADDGATWQSMAIGRPLLIATAVRDGHGRILVAGAARALQVSTDGGRSFAPMSGGVESAVAELVLAPDGAVIALGEEGACRLP